MLSTQKAVTWVFDGSVPAAMVQHTELCQQLEHAASGRCSTMLCVLHLVSMLDADKTEGL